MPLQDLVDKFSHVRFEPAGMTKNPEVRFAKSIVDYIFRWLAAKFLSPEEQYRRRRERPRRGRGAAAEADAVQLPLEPANGNGGNAEPTPGPPSSPRCRTRRTRRPA